MATSPPHCCSTGASTTACQRPTGALEVCLAASGTTAMKAGECNMRDGIRSSAEITEPIVHGKVEAKPQGIGVALPRLEDPRLLTGHGCFADDVNRPGQAWGYVLRSPIAHARIKGIDVRGALEIDGVYAVLTGEDYMADGLAGTRTRNCPLGRYRSSLYRC